MNIPKKSPKNMGPTFDKQGKGALNTANPKPYDVLMCRELLLLHPSRPPVTCGWGSIIRYTGMYRVSNAGSETKQFTKKGESSRKAVGMRKGNWRLIRTYKLQSRGLSRVDYIGEYFRAYLGRDTRISVYSSYRVYVIFLPVSKERRNEQGNGNH